eukprot:Pompholyxophrys_sp_v1_NODE_11_length_5290_cov_18.520778.p3 type:complete len:214 gc:universal NODE_11_length_5290_cov_18.520778:2516-3157(+)
MNIFIFVRALRTRNFYLMVASLEELCPLFFALDKQNYSRWPPVHIRDLKSLPRTILQEFLDGNFVVSKTTAKFSAIAIDHCHEQENATFKGDGGAVGLTENPMAFRCWLLSVPDLVRVISEFERCFVGNLEEFESTEHHEHGKAYQIKFHEQVNSLVSAILEVGNPFSFDFSDLVTLDCQDVVSDDILASYRNLWSIGQNQYKLRFSKWLNFD